LSSSSSTRRLDGAPPCSRIERSLAGPDKSRAKLDAFIAAMQAGEWTEPSNMVLDDSGRLLEGWHRCVAVLTSGARLGRLSPASAAIRGQRIETTVVVRPQ
jgi:hypothetical protein